jgi:hypothetical protein
MHVVNMTPSVKKPLIHRDMLVCVAERAQQNRRGQNPNLVERGENSLEANELGVPMSNSFRSICNTRGDTHNILNFSFFNDLVRLMAAQAPLRRRLTHYTFTFTLIGCRAWKCLS